MDDCNTYCVYIHTNKFNDKKYIGQTKYGDNINRRWRNGDGYKYCRYFNYAIQKYGWDNFEHEIVYNQLTINQANMYEQWLIYLGDTTNPLYGYNIMKGGKNGFSMTDAQTLKRVKNLQETIREKHKVKSFESLGDRYNSGDLNIIKCKQCGALFEVKPKWNHAHTKRNLNGRNRKYCDDCKNIRNNGSSMKVVTCADCGVDFIVSTNNTASYRFKECQSNYQKFKNKEKQPLNRSPNNSVNQTHSTVQN